MKEIWAENGIFIVLILALTAFWFYRTFILPLIAENSLKGQYQSMAEPILMLQDFETQGDFWKRVERSRERFRQSGNRFAEKQSPIVAIPYNGYFEVDWFGEKYSLDTVGLGRMEYLIAAMSLYKTLFSVWAKNVYGVHGEKVFYEAMKGQIPPIPAEDVWANKN